MILYVKKYSQYIATVEIEKHNRKHSTTIFKRNAPDND